MDVYWVFSFLRFLWLDTVLYEFSMCKVFNKSDEVVSKLMID